MLHVPGEDLIFLLFESPKEVITNTQQISHRKKPAFSPSYFHFTAVKMGEGKTRCKKSETENKSSL